MRPVLALTPLHDALAELELAAALVLPAEQEAQPIPETLPRLRRAVSVVHGARALTIELTQAMGRPTLCVLDGGAVPPDAA